MTTSKDPPSLNTIAEHCAQAARYLKGAASAIRHGRIATARQKLAATFIIIAYLKQQQL